jgi:putative PIN family toxin of toxin-antitoxin system
MIYAVIDTNVIVSALITHNSEAATIAVVEHVLSGSITPVYNEDILKEYDEVLHRPKFKLSHNDIRPLLDYIEYVGIAANRLQYDGNMPDEKDRPFYEVSLSKDDAYLVTGNMKHFPSTPKVVSPSEMIAILSKGTYSADING